VQRPQHCRNMCLPSFFDAVNITALRALLSVGLSVCRTVSAAYRGTLRTFCVLRYTPLCVSV
jgi:hypothetical protein